jgi:hypothetical protein
VDQTRKNQALEQDNARKVFLPKDYSQAKSHGYYFKKDLPPNLRVKPDSEPECLLKTEYPSGGEIKSRTVPLWSIAQCEPKTAKQSESKSPDRQEVDSHTDQPPPLVHSHYDVPVVEDPGKNKDLRRRNLGRFPNKNIGTDDPQVKDLLNLIITRHLIEGIPSSEFVRLKRTYVDRWLGIRYGNAKEVILTAEALGLIEVDRRYEIGRYSRGYRLAEPYREFKVERLKTTESNTPEPKGRSSPVTNWLAENLKRIDCEIPVVVTNRKDDFGYRFHSSLTNCPKNLLNRMTVDGEGLVELDVANSQPLMLAVTLRKRGIPCDGYAALVESGTLYDTIAAECRMTRRQAKEALITKVFYGSNRVKTRVKTWFRSRFPEIHAFIEQTKARDPKRLPRTLQRTESSVVIYGACEAMRTNNPGLFVATRHDSLLCKPGDLETVKAYLTAELAKWGLRCNLKTTILKSEDTEDEDKQPPQDAVRSLQGEDHTGGVADSTVLSGMVRPNRRRYGQPEGGDYEPPEHPNPPCRLRCPTGTEATTAGMGIG